MVLEDFLIFNYINIVINYREIKIMKEKIMVKVDNVVEICFDNDLKVVDNLCQQIGKGAYFSNKKGIIGGY